MRYLTTTASQPEAEMICSRLKAADIVAVPQRRALARASRASAFGTHDIYVEEKNLDSARELLESGEGISEAELVAAEEADAAARAARHPMPPRAGDAALASARKRALWARLRGQSQ